MFDMNSKPSQTSIHTQRSIVKSSTIELTAGKQLICEQTNHNQLKRDLNQSSLQFNHHQKSQLVAVGRFDHPSDLSNAWSSEGVL